MTGMCLVELERHLVLNSDRYDTYPMVKSAIGDYVEQMRHKSDPMEVGEIAHQGKGDHDTEWDELQAIACGKGKGKNKGKGKGKDAKGAGKNSSRSKSGDEDPDYFPYKRHNCGEKGHKAAQCGKDKCKGRERKGVYGVDEDHAEETSSDIVQELGDRHPHRWPSIM